MDRLLGAYYNRENKKRQRTSKEALHPKAQDLEAVARPTGNFFIQFCCASRLT